MPNKLRPAIESHFNFSDYPEAAPQLDELLMPQQQALAGAYLRDHTFDVLEVFEAVSGDDSIAVNLAALMDGTIDDDGKFELLEALKLAGPVAFETAINNRIEQMWEQHCKDFGVFDSDSDHGPGELRGFDGAA